MRKILILTLLILAGCSSDPIDIRLLENELKFAPKLTGTHTNITKFSIFNKEGQPYSGPVFLEQEESLLENFFRGNDGDNLFALGNPNPGIYPNFTGTLNEGVLDEKATFVLGQFYFDGNTHDNWRRTLPDLQYLNQLLFHPIIDMLEDYPLLMLFDSYKDDNDKSLPLKFELEFDRGILIRLISISVGDFIILEETMSGNDNSAHTLYYPNDYSINSISFNIKSVRNSKFLNYRKSTFGQPRVHFFNGKYEVFNKEEKLIESRVYNIGNPKSVDRDDILYSMIKKTFNKDGVLFSSETNINRMWFSVNDILGDKYNSRGELYEVKKKYTPFEEYQMSKIWVLEERTVYHDNGQKALVTPFAFYGNSLYEIGADDVHSMENGVSEEFDRDGNVISEITYVAGRSQQEIDDINAENERIRKQNYFYTNLLIKNDWVLSNGAAAYKFNSNGRFNLSTIYGRSDGGINTQKGDWFRLPESTNVFGIVYDDGSMDQVYFPTEHKGEYFELEYGQKYYKKAIKEDFIY